MVDIDLDIVTEKKTTIRLFGEDRTLRDLTMEENFEVAQLRQEVNQANLDKDMKKHRKARKELLRAIIEPISDDEINNIKYKQFEALMEQIDFIDLRDQGVIKTIEEYRKMKADTAKRAMERNADQLFQQPL